MMTATRVETIPPITQAEVERLAKTEYARVAAQLRSLAVDDWSKATECPLWDVRAMAGHSTGMLSTFTGYRTLMSEMRTATKAAKRSGEPLIDALLRSRSPPTPACRRRSSWPRSTTSAREPPGGGRHGPPCSARCR